MCASIECPSGSPACAKRSWLAPRSERREELLRLLDEFYGFLWAGQEEVFTRRERLEDAAAGDPYEELDALIEAVL
jgi:hypothetical protein